MTDLTKYKLLVALASHGTANDRHLQRVLQEYRSMRLRTDVVVFTNLEKRVSPNIELIVASSSGDPRALPFLHKQIFAERLHCYDLFLYSEDDILITEENIAAFLKASDTLSETEIPGFLRFEEGPYGRSYPDIHGRFHWEVNSVKKSGDTAWAFFTNEHSACYLLTSEQLGRAIASGGYLVPPHQGKYDLQCTAATDPYTQCGFRKLLCISELEPFLVHHLSNKYVGTRFGIDDRELHQHLRLLMAVSTTNQSTETANWCPQHLYPRAAHEEVTGFRSQQWLRSLLSRED